MADVSPRAGETGQDGHSLGPPARLLLWLGVVALAFVIFIIAAPIDSWFPSATGQAREVDGLFKFMIAASGVIYIYVQGLLLAFVLRYRRKKGATATALPPRHHGNTRLEIAWSAGPAVLIVVLAVLSLVVWQDEHTVRKNELLLQVHGYQFGWAFSLPRYGIKDAPSVTIPVNRPVVVSERSTDVIHSFWVPAFRAKQDAVPGLVTEERFTPVEMGTFSVICTEFRGAGHSGMVTTLTVAREADFVAWLRGNGARTLPADAATPR